MVKPKKHPLGGMARKLVCGAASLALVVGLTPAAAFASAGGSDSDDTGFFTLPQTYVTDLNHRATDSSTSSYRYLSSGISRIVGGFSQSMYYLMGINGVNFDRGLRNNAPWNSVKDGVLTTNHVTAVDGIMGTEVNSVPDEYLWNSCVYMNQNPGTALTSVPRDTTFNNKMVWVYQSTGNPSTYETVEVEVDGATYNMPSVIYMEANFISSNDSDWTAQGGKAIKDWVEIEKKRTNSDYNPYIATWTTNSGGIKYGCELMYELADAVDTVTDQSRVDGYATVMSRYVNANGDRTEEGLFDSAKSLAQSYEDFAKATQYYMIDQIANNNLQKKVVAVICGYDPGTGKNVKGETVEGSYTGDEAYACRIFDPSTTGLTNDTANYGGRLANSVMNFTTDINTVLSEKDVAFPAKDGEQNVVRWYTAKQIAETADAVFVCDAPYGNGRAVYLAYNSAGDQASIYTDDNNSYDKTNENVEPLAAACGASGAKADIYYKFPCHLFGVWYAQGFENCWFAPMAAAWLYPQNFTSIENVMAYAAKNFWHINSADVNGVLKATCGDISMPAGSVFGTPDSNYQDVLDNIMATGNSYYLSSKSVRKNINAMNCGDLETYSLSDLEDRTDVDIPAASVSVPAQTYTGSALTPKPTVSLAGATLKEGVDYTLSYSNNVNAGTAKITIQGIGSYNGSKDVSFTINKAANTLTAKAKKSTTKIKYAKLKKKAQSITAAKAYNVSKAIGTVTYAKKSGSKKITVNAKTGKITIKKGAIKKGKTAKVTINVKAAGDANHAAATKAVTLKIKAK